jgi:hypothetical protein
MAEARTDDHDSDLPPPGSRWGSGAQSVLPYLTKTLQAKPAAAAEPRLRDTAPADSPRPSV